MNADLQEDHPSKSCYCCPDYCNDQQQVQVNIYNLCTKKALSKDGKRSSDISSPKPEAFPRNVISVLGATYTRCQENGGDFLPSMILKPTGLIFTNC